MSAYRIAHLSPQQLTAVEHLENEIGVTLVAYEPAAGFLRSDAAEGAMASEVTGTDTATDEGAAIEHVMDTLVDTYRISDFLH